MIQSVLVQKAIKAALHSEWNEAIEFNEKILEQSPRDLDSLNRLARAFFETGNITKSKEIYKEVLEQDPYNVIALKNMKRFQLLKGSSEEISNTIVRSLKNSSHTKSVTSFIEEPGKTKVMQLVRLAEPHVLFTLHCGDQVQLVPKLRGVHAFSNSNVYIGRLPDDIAYQLQIFIKSGNKYEAYVKQIQANAVHIFVREISRTAEFASRPTFSYLADSIPTSQETAPESEISDEEDATSEEQI